MWSQYIYTNFKCKLVLRAFLFPYLYSQKFLPRNFSYSIFRKHWYQQILTSSQKLFLRFKFAKINYGDNGDLKKQIIAF